MSNNKKPNLSIEQIEKGVEYNKAIIKNLFIFYAIAGPVCLVVALMMFFVGNGKFMQYGVTLSILFVLCTVYVIMAYVRRKRVLNELVRQQQEKEAKKAKNN